MLALNHPRLLSSRFQVFGCCLLLAYGLLVIRGAVPVQLLNPAWQVAATSVLVDQAPIALVGLALFYLAGFLDPDNFRLQARVAWVGRLAILASLGFLLLIPLRAYNIWSLPRAVDSAQESRIDNASVRLNRMRNAVRSASSKEDLAAQWRELSIPPLPAALQAQPLPVIRAQMNRTFTQMEAALEQQRQQEKRKNAPIQNLALVNGRQMLASLLYALAFAAGGQRSRSPFTFLDDLLHRLRFSSALPSPSQRSDTAEIDDYIKLLDSEQDPAQKPPGS